LTEGTGVDVRERAFLLSTAVGHKKDLKTSSGRISGRRSEAPRSGCEADCIRIQEETAQGDGDEIQD